MSFLHPTFLWGLVLVSVPIALHFLLRRRVRRVPFSSLVLLRLLQKKRSRRMRLAQLLLLLLRMVIVCVVVLLFAQPVFRSGFLSGFQSGPERVVVFVDNSQSLSVRGANDESTYQRLRRQLQQRLSRFDPRTTVVVVALSPRAAVVFRGGIAQFDEGVIPEPTKSRPDVASAINRLDDLFGSAAASRRRVVVFSDFQKEPWSAALKKLRTLSCPVDLHRVAPESFSNWSIVRIMPEQQRAVIGEEVNFIVELAYSASPGPVRPNRLVAEIDGTVAAALDVRPRSESHGRIRVEVPVTVATEGFASVQFRLDDDGLLSDNVTTSSVPVIHERLVLLFNGDPRSAALNDEVFFLRRVYERALRQQYRVRVFAGERVPTRGEIASAVIIHLAAYAPRDEGLAEQLLSYLEGGGTLVLWAGSTLDGVSASRNILEPITGKRLSGIAEQLSPWVVNDSAETPLGHLLSAQYVGPIASRMHYFLADGTTGADQHRGMALKLEDGSPLLLVTQRKEGHFLFFNTTADQEWSDFPVHPLYPVLLSTLPRLTKSGVVRLAQGDSYSIDVDLAGRGDATAEVRTPHGRKVVVKPQFFGERFCFAFDDTWWPGVYRMVRTVGSEYYEDVFEVYPEEKETNLDYVSAEDIAEQSHSSGGSGAHRDSGIRFSDLVIFLLLFLLIAEMAVLISIERTIHGEVDEA